MYFLVQKKDSEFHPILDLEGLNWLCMLKLSIVIHAMQSLDIGGSQWCLFPRSHHSRIQLISKFNPLASLHCCACFGDTQMMYCLLWWPQVSGYCHIWSLFAHIIEFSHPNIETVHKIQRSEVRFIKNDAHTVTQCVMAIISLDNHIQPCCYMWYWLLLIVLGSWMTAATVVPWACWSL